MPFHVSAYTLLIGAVANTDVPALSDDILFIQNNHFILQTPSQLLAAWAGSPTIARARINSPTIRQVAPRYIRPLNAAILPANNPNIDFMPQMPFTLPAQEEIQIEGTAAPGTTERFTALLWLSSSVDPVPPGQLYRTRVTSTTAAVANAWTTIALTFEQSLPAGSYVMVGGEMQSTNIIAFRTIFDLQTYRPGFLGINALGSRNPWQEYQQQFGVWGRFRTISLPRCQVLCNAADAAFEGYFDFVRVGM